MWLKRGLGILPNKQVFGYPNAMLAISKPPCLEALEKCFACMGKRFKTHKCFTARFIFRGLKEEQTDNIISVLSHPFWQQKGGALNLDLTSFILSIVASIIADFVCKWLDGDDCDN